MIGITFDIRGYMGKPRSGKTISLVGDGYEIFLELKYLLYELEEKLKKGKKLDVVEQERYKIFKNFRIISNLTLNKKIFGNYEHINFDALIAKYKAKESLEYCLILFDDIFKNVDSRKFMNESNMIMSYLITEVGKNNSIFRYVSHFKHMFEKRLQDFTDTFYYCQKGKYKIITFKDAKLRIWQEDKNYYELPSKKDYDEMIIKRTALSQYMDIQKDLDMRQKAVSKDYIEAKKYFKMYNTREIM